MRLAAEFWPGRERHLLLAFDMHAWPVHRVAVALGYAAAGVLYLILQKRWERGLPPLETRQRMGIGAGALVGAIAGAAMIGWAESFTYLWRSVGEGEVRGHVALGSLL